MIKHTFKYCATHKDDEAYMQAMCQKGYAAVRLVEGFWTFKECEPNEYCYRICYLRGMKNDEIIAYQEELKKREIEFVGRYSFWGICRSHQPFILYDEKEDLAITKKIYAPMPIGAIVSWILCLVSLYLIFKVSHYFVILCVLSLIYATMCTWLGISYHKLLSKKSNI